MAIRHRVFMGFSLALFLAAITQPAQAQFEFDPSFQVRLRGIVINPNEKESIEPIGGSADVSTEWVPEVDLTFFYNDKFSIELIAAIAEHTITVRDSILGDVAVGDVLVLPPTILLQYHFNTDGKIRPYIGGGVNITGFFDEDAAVGSAVTDFNVETSFGPAAQFGIDYFLDENWFINADFKYIFIDGDLTADTSLGVTVTADAQINPFVFGFGVGYKF